MKKRIPYSIADYEEIVRGNYYFVDKTRFIRELEHWKLPIFLRPRRFGKSLWCSILECYYDINRREIFDELFASTDIGKAPTLMRNSQLVLRLDCSKVPVCNDYDKLEGRFDEYCSGAFAVFLAQYADFFPRALELPRNATTALQRLLVRVKTDKLPPVHIIIDEYDNFTNQLLTTRQDTLYYRTTGNNSFLKDFYKTVKAGVGEGTVARCFITGVLPVTMDDMTSGFNIGQIVTMDETLLPTMGFTQAEVETYVDAIFTDHSELAPLLRQKVLDDLKTYYNGYRLLPDAVETLYNSTVCNYYLDSFVKYGIPPRDPMDANLATDVGWIQLLADKKKVAIDCIRALLFENSLPFAENTLKANFNARHFLDKSTLPISLYYLGLGTFMDNFRLTLPNLTVRSLVTQYYNTLQRIDVGPDLFAPVFAQFVKDHDLGKIFAAYWEHYIGKIPAQAFDKANENFFRTTFYTICQDYLQGIGSVAIEVNYAHGRCDFEILGRPDAEFAGQAFIIEFKYHPASSGMAKKITAWTTPPAEHLEQLATYAKDLEQKYPGQYAIRTHLVYIVGNRNYRFFPLHS